MSFNMCQLKIHIVTDSISSIYSFMNRDRVFMPSYSTFNGHCIITFIASLFNFYNEIFITLWTKPNIVPRSTMMETLMLFRSSKVLLSQPNNNHNPNNKTTITVVGLRQSNRWEPPTHHHHPPPGTQNYMIEQK